MSDPQSRESHQSNKVTAEYIHCWFCHQFTSPGICRWCGVDSEATSELRIASSLADPFTSIQNLLTPPILTFSQKLRVPFMRWHIWEHIVLVSSAAKWFLLASLVGILTGSASALFLTLLSSATLLRVSHPWLLWLLPICGFFIGYVYYRWGNIVERGNNLILDHIHKPGAGVPFLMAPLILSSTVLTHLFGGSAGREGTAVQMGGSLAGWLARSLRLNPHNSRILLMSGMSAGFGAIFGTPLAGAVFGMEVQTVGRIRYEGIVPCLVGSIVGDQICRWWGVGHTHYRAAEAVTLNLPLFAMLIVAGILFGIVALLFSEITHAISEQFKKFVKWPPLRPVIGGLLIIALTYMVGSRDYLGLSLPLLTEATEGGQIVYYAFALKLLFTSITIGSGFKGGEVTPLFVIGATLGHALGVLFGGPPALFAAVGFVAVFGAAANTPLACLLMGIELFGSTIAVPYGIACILAYIFSGHRGIYLAQRVEIPKSRSLRVNYGETLRDLRDRYSDEVKESKIATKDTKA